MAEVERRRAEVPATAQPAVDLENLPTLFGKLGDDVMRLVDTKLSLIKVELKEDASFYARNGAFTAVGAMVALIGFALVNVAVAFFISNFFANDAVAPQRFGPTSYGLGFLITGILYVVIGGVIVLLMKNKLAAYNPVPTTTLD
ncbi:MAG: putative Actinobacterial Holin-X, holin superfamily, partial [Acidobacteriota bacterium]|nr:putative Actinobacterial Holin-X, holin superfamily [Acidobacteriota bacterium]